MWFGEAKSKYLFPIVGPVSGKCDGFTAWCLPTHTAAIQRRLLPPPRVYGGMTCTGAACCTQCKLKMGYRRSGLSTQSQSRTCLINAFLCWREDYIQLIPACTLSLSMQVCVCLCVCVRVSFASIKYYFCVPKPSYNCKTSPTVSQTLVRWTPASW